MPWWFALILFAVSTVLGVIFRPKVTAPKPATLAELDFPTAEETRSIPKGYGTFLMKAPNVVSVTDFSSEAIKQKPTTLQKVMSFGLMDWLTKDPIIGYKYFCGIEMALCYRVDALLQIIIDDKIAWTGSQTTDGEIYINKPTLFGGQDPASGGNGGVQGYLGIHLGDPAATKDPYLISQYTNYTAHRGIHYVVWKGQKRAKGSGYLGNSSNVAPWQFVARFIPNNLGVPAYSNINSGDANPAEVLYDVLRNGEYAVGLSDDFIDIPSFQAAAETYFNDGYGFSALWDTSKPCRQIIEAILQYTDSVLYSDFQTGKLVLKPARADYDVNTIPHFTDADIISITSYTRGAWSETTNEVKIPFVNRLDNFIEQVGLAQDLANQRIQAIANGGNGTVSSNIQHVGISNPTTAANIAQRDLKALTTPLAKASIQVNLKAHRVTVGEPFKLSTNKIKDHNGNPITELVMRSNGLKIGDPNNPVIALEAIEDLFDSTVAVYASSPGSSAPPTSIPPVATSTHLLDELPFLLAPNDAPRLWAMAAAPTDGTFTFDLFTSLDGTDYEADDPNNSFAPTGLLASAYSRYTAAKENTGTLIIAAAGSSGLDRLLAATATEVQNGANMVLLVEGSKVEAVGFESFSINGGGDYVLGNVWRGLLDTTPQSFTSAARAWFFSYGDARSLQGFIAGTTGYGKIITRTLQGVLDETAATALNRTMGVRALRPYAPGNIRINAVYNGTVPATGDVVIAWSHRDRTRQGNNTLQNAGTVGLEGGAFYTLKIYNQAGTLLRTATNLVTETYTYTNAQEMADNGGVLADALTFQIYTTRAGITSYQAQHRGSARTGSTIFEPSYTASGTYVAPPVGDTTSIGGIPITGTPTGTNNTPVYDPTTGTIIWQPGSGGVTVREIDGTPSGVATTIEFPNTQVTDMGGGVFRITPLQGAPGVDGTDGTDGVDGTNGTDGVDGAPGSVWYVGSGVPAGGLGINGDKYLDGDTGNVYHKAAGAWTVAANIKGDDGADGNDAIGSGTFYFDENTETYILDDNTP